MYQFVESSLQKVGLKVDPEFLVKLLESLGINDPADVQRLTETHLSGALKVEEANKLLAYWIDSSERYDLLLVLRLQRRCYYLDQPVEYLIISTWRNECAQCTWPKKPYNVLQFTSVYDDV